MSLINLRLLLNQSINLWKADLFYFEFLARNSWTEHENKYEITEINTFNLYNTICKAFMNPLSLANPDHTNTPIFNETPCILSPKILPPVISK